MKTKYTLDWLINKYENGTKLKYVYFWGHSNTIGQINKSCFSQWYESPFTVNGILYKTAEHWMMAQKALLFENRELFDKIINCVKPAEAKELGRQVTEFNEEVWKEKRFELVRTGSIHKFNQNRELGNFLLNTENRILVEASPMDNIWGIGMAHDHKDIDNLYLWNGQNLLGFALMEARDFLKEYGFFNEVNGPQTPWNEYPDITPYDHFLKEFAAHFEIAFSKLSEKEKVIFMLLNPEPDEYKNKFYLKLT